MFASMPRQSSKAILQHSPIHAMEFTALRILWDDDDEDLDLDLEFLEDLYGCWSGLKSQRYMAPREHGSAGRHTGTHVLNNPVHRFPETGFRACFRIERASFWQLIYFCENTQQAATTFFALM